MSLIDDDLLDILKYNFGFDEHDLWLEYARTHGFKRTPATPCPLCFDCGTTPTHSIGQFIHYSTLLRLRECRRCGLIWADAQLDQQIIHEHFEAAYKDDQYFAARRKDISDHIARLVDRLAPKGAQVLDIGGAKGHMMTRVVARRPDLRITVHDVSKAATEYAESRFGFTVLCSDIPGLASIEQRYGVVVLSDVLYYEPQLTSAWRTLDHLVDSAGSIVIRVPNHVFLMRFGQALFTLSRPRRRRLLQDRVPFFNPEHIFVLTRQYLTRRLKGLGFAEVECFPSPLLSGPWTHHVKKAWFRLAATANAVSMRRLILTPSMVVVGKGKNTKEGPSSDDLVPVQGG